MKKSIGTVFLRAVSVLTVAALIFTGCGKNKSETSETEPVSVKSGKTYGVTDGGKSGVSAVTNSADSIIEGAKADESAPAYSTDSGIDFRGAADSSDVLYEMKASVSATESIWDPEEKPYPEPVEPRAGLLTAGEWNDNLHPDFLRNLLANGQEQNYKEFFTAWGMLPFNKITVHVTDLNGDALKNAYVAVMSADSTEMGHARTDNNGIAYVYYNLADNTGDIPATVLVQTGDMMTEHEVSGTELMDDSVTEILFPGLFGVSKQLDLMMVIDTTGSMGDEIRYLQTELEDVIGRVSRDNANLPINLSVNFYRDMEDDYVVRSHPFSSNINEQMSYLRVEYANGGGDYEEAVELALDDAVNNHAWSSDSVKIMFLVLDAPPHNTADIKASLASTVSRAAELGIRIVPIASSGVDKSTEFLLRTLAMTTGGTYTFLTDDSGIGGAHLEPTVGSYEVEYLNDMMVRIIDGYLK